MSELKPCPFCGSTNIKRIDRTIGPMRSVCVVIECFDCTGSVHSIDHTEGFVDGRWNNRSPQSEWVSVDDRLPEESGAYWTFNGGDETGSVIIQRVHMFDIDYGCFNSCTVTHWMLLPTPPKGE